MLRRSCGLFGFTRQWSACRRAVSTIASDGKPKKEADKPEKPDGRQLVRVVSSKSLSVNKHKPRIVVIGTGWGGFTFVHSVDRSKYDVQVISPVNHSLTTPLLCSAVVGTLEYRIIQNPIRTVPNIHYYQAKAQSIDYDKRQVLCEDIFQHDKFGVEYDFLVISTGAKTNTFGIPGIAESEEKEVFFLKHLYHARLIRNRILECFERAAIHLTEPKERDRLLTFVIVGGGPTNCELIGELHDFITKDVKSWYPDLVPYIQIYLVEASDRLLGSFDPFIARYVEKRFKRQGFHVKTGVSVQSFDTETKTAHLSDGTQIPTGLMVWSAGLQQTRFVQEGLPEIEHGPGNRIVVDDYLQIQNDLLDDRVFALGDCALNLKQPLAPLAQAASQQATYLAKAFNNAPTGVGLDLPASEMRKSMEKPFKYFSLGSMVTFGGFRGAIDLTAVGSPDEKKNFGFIHGILSYFMWRSAYLLKQTSWTNRLLIPMYWFKSFFFGRDISRF